MFRVSYLILTFAGLSPDKIAGIVAAVMGLLLVAILAVVIVSVVIYCCHPCRSKQDKGAYTYRQTETFTCSCFLYLCLL